MVLFGSRARGDGAPDSDIDVMVVIAEENRELRRALLDIAYGISWEYGCWLVPPICSERETCTAPSAGTTLSTQASEGKGFRLPGEAHGHARYKTEEPQEMYWEPE